MPFQIITSTYSQRLRFGARILVKALALNVSCLVFLFTSSASAQVTVTAMPAFSPVAGTYSSAQTVTISTTTPSATIYYTTNGTTPTTNATVYSGAITVSASETVGAIATANGLSNSAVSSAAYTIGTVVAPSCSGMSLGNGASLNGFVPFPLTNVWNTNIVSAPVDPNSAAIVAASGFAGWYLHPDFGSGSGDGGIPYVVVDSTTTPIVSINVIDYASQSDVVVAPYPITAPIEGNPADCSGWPDTYNGDAHVLVLDRAKCELYETYNTNRCNGHWDASSETIWDMHNYESRPFGWTSADAAGLSVFPGLVRYDEIASGAINHALRFTLEQTKNDANNGYFVSPATHAAGNNPATSNVMGMRIRLKASFDISGFSPVNQIILTAMQQYGLILADNGPNFYFQGTSDPRFDDNDLVNLEQIASSNFEVVQSTPEFPGYDSATAPKGAAPTIDSFTASASNVSAQNPVTITYSASGDSYDYIDTIGPVSGGSATVTPTETNTYTLYSTNAYGRSVSTPITVTVPGSVVAAPTFTPVAGTYSSAQTLTINTPTSPLATIYYTTDGTVPTTSSTEYSGPITVSATQMVKAIATVTGYSVPSGVGSAAYTIGSADTVGDLVKAKAAATPAVAQPPGLVAHGMAQNSAGTLGVTVPATGGLNMTGANFIHVCTSQSGTTPTPTDSSGNTYQLVLRQGEGGDAVVYSWVSFGPTVTSSMTFTAGGVNVAEVSGWSGVASGPDGTSQSQNEWTYSLTSGSITPTNANELVLSCFGAYGASPNAISSPMTLLDFMPATGTRPAGVWINGLGLAYQIHGGTSSAINPTWTNSIAFGAAIVSESYYSQESPAPLIITTTHLPEGFVSTVYGSTSSLYSNQLTQTGGAGGPYTWTLTAGTLPAGLSLRGGGLITGTPTGTVSATSLTFKVTDGYSNTASVTLPMTIASTAFSGTAGTCTGSALNGTQYVAYGGCTLSATGGTSPYAYTFNSSLTGYGHYAIPEGLTLNRSTGGVSGTVYGEGSYNTVTFLASDNLGTNSTVSVIFSITGNNNTHGCLPWVGSIFNQRIDSLPVDTSPAAAWNSGSLSSHLTIETAVGGGIPWISVPYNQASSTISTIGQYSYTISSFPPNSSQSPGTASAPTPVAGTGPVPSYNPVEGTFTSSGDRHVETLVESGGGNACQSIDQWESIWQGSYWQDASNYYVSNLGSSGANAYAMPERGSGVGADAAGLPILPLLPTVQEVQAGVIAHPIRFTTNQPLAKYVWPAVQQAGEYGGCSGGFQDPDGNGLIVQPNSGINQPPMSCTVTMPMGEIYRLSASAYASLAATYPCLTNATTNPQASVVFTALRNYGIIVADVGDYPSDLIFTADAAWNPTDLACITNNIIDSDFEPVNVQSVIKTLDGSNLPTVSYQTSSSTSTQAATPAFSPAAGTYSSAQTVTVSSATPSATIYYTTNGSTPTTSSAVYSGPITVSSTETLQAIAAATGYSTSATGSAAYTINLTQVATPSFTVAVSPASLTVTAGQSGTTTILVTPQNAFGGAVSFSCSGLPSGASCSFSPTTVTTSGTVASTTLTVTTSTTTAALHRNSSPLFPGSVLAVALCWFGWKKRRGLQMLPLVLVALGLSLCTGCSLGVWTNSPATTQATASTVTVIATSGSLQPTTSFTLTVQ